MPLYQMNLLEYLEQLSNANKIEKIFTVAKKLLDIFKLVHTAQRTYNDLKPENIMINLADPKDYESEPMIYLVDFGFTDKYIISETQEHIEEYEQIDMFQGNLLYASPGQMKFIRTSRRDDLISLFYLVIYLLNNYSYG